jgi:hypothetical protein
MASFSYGQGVLRLLRGSTATTPIDWIGDTVKCGLSSSTHVPNKDDQFVDDGGADDFTDGELSGTGYVIGFGNAGRKSIGSKTMAYNAANDRVELDGADVSWTAISAGTAAQATVLKEGTTNTDSPVLGNVDTGGFPVVTNGGDVTIQWNAGGIFQHTV